MFIRIKIITTTGHHNDGFRGISAYVNDPKRICATRTLLINRTSKVDSPPPHRRFAPAGQRIRAVHTHLPPSCVLSIVHGQTPSAPSLCNYTRAQLANSATHWLGSPARSALAFKSYIVLRTSYIGAAKRLRRTSYIVHRRRSRHRLRHTSYMSICLAAAWVSET